jgi:3-oxoacyl-[acyl-carrier-protein] synthase II
MRRVVITGYGSINGAGKTSRIEWQRLLTGGPDFLSVAQAAEVGALDFQLDDLPPAIAGAMICPVRGTRDEFGEWVNLNPRNYDRHQLFAFIAADEAMQSIPVRNRDRFGCIGATGGAGLLAIDDASMRAHSGGQLSPRDNLKYLPNIAAGYLTQRYGLAGASDVHGSACAAGLNAIINAARMIGTGELDAALVVGAEAAISPFGILSFQAQRRALGKGLPFHKERDGFVMGEGAAAIVLEDEAQALEREAVIYARVLGYGQSSDAVEGVLITDPSPQGAVRSMTSALIMAKTSMAQIDLVKAHATATKNGDRSEVAAIAKCVGDGVTAPLVTAPKSFYGHLLGAAGVAETVTVLQMFEHRKILPTRGLASMTDVAEDCRGVTHVHGFMEAPSLERVLLNGFGFGGTNATLILERAGD